MLTRISILLSVVAAVALFLAVDVGVLHILPTGFERVGAFAFLSGGMLSLLAIFFAAGGLVAYGKSRAGIHVFIWSVAQFLAFGFLRVYAIS